MLCRKITPFSLRKGRMSVVTKTIFSFLALFSLILTSCCNVVTGTYDIPNNEFLPKPVTYFTSNSGDDEVANISSRTQDVRFNQQLSSTNNILEGLPMNLLTTGIYPLKIDLGGLLLGAVVGLGALVVIPKLVHLLSSELTGYGQSYHGTPYGRYENGIPEGLNQIVAQIEDILNKNHVNSTTCIQKAICSYIHSMAKPANVNGRMDPLIDKVISNSIVNFLIDGSKFKSALENGVQGGTNCGSLYPQCPFTKDSITNGVKQIIMNNMSDTMKDKTYNIDYNLYNKETDNNVDS